MSPFSPHDCAAPFDCQKLPARGSRAMVVTNHPLASGAAVQMLLEGGNAVDAAVAALFTLTVVEPMMVGILGGGLTHLRLANGQHQVLDGLSTAPAAARPDMYEALSMELDRYRETRDRANEYGALAVAVPGALAGWCALLARHGRLPLADVIAPAERLAARGFTVTPYLATNATAHAAVLARDPGLARLFLPGGRPIEAGERLVQSDYAASLRLIAQLGPAALYEGALGLGAIGFGSPESIHLLAQALSIAFADRSFATADPDFVEVPVDTLISRSYADDRRSRIDLRRAQRWQPGLPRHESADTTHLTVADGEGNIVASTQTINGLFGACVQVAGTGMLANNYMFNFDPHPGHALSVAPGKRVFTSMSPMMLLREGRPRAALGLPGGLRIFPSALQALINLVDHGMSLQQAVEAPRIWTEGGVLELEETIPTATAASLESMGYRIARVPRIAGGMNAIGFDEDGLMTGAACWRADGTPIAVAGGLARAGVGFSIV